MKITVITIFPGYFSSPLNAGVVGRAIEAGYLEIETVDLRDFATGFHRQVDDAPYGGGAGMVMMIEPLAKALEPLSDTVRVLMTPAGKPLDQEMLDRFATLDHLTLVCGRYEGVDERVVEHFIDEEVSVGDFVLPGGEAAALTVIEGIGRLIPGVLGNEQSIAGESFRDSLLAEPHYTRPADYRGWKVPEVLLSGDHGRIEEWRADQRLERTRRRRPDLLD
ncbi:MAG TPA: tRNA (guanosine(37)-N1)-methyltransferase TrmD [Acidimicrobiia bacterium]|nr:tRNA (guanosine(37)-N1)-methyltransferase TrmD [Acidimicrobiia bacterium]